jgi:NADPH:quinone reductase-like Zn-dependent oxidoreductase
VFAAYAKAPDPTDPLAALVLGERPDPQPPAGWTTVRVRAASLNMHDVNTLRGVRMSPERYPMVLGCDGTGVLDDGTEVVIHSCISSPGWVGPETLDPGRSVLSEHHQGSFAELVVVPARNVVPKPPSLTHAEAACLPTAWLTAYRMLFVSAGVHPGQTILVDGRDRLGSIATAVIQLARAAGFEVWAIARRPRDRELADQLGAHRVFRDDEHRLPGQVDAVFDAGVDEAGWSHAVPLLRPGAAVVCAGWRSGATAVGYRMGLDDLIFRELRLVGSTMGTVEDLANLLSFLDRTGLRPPIALELPLRRADEGIRTMLAGGVPGKIVFTA